MRKPKIPWYVDPDSDERANNMADYGHLFEQNSSKKSTGNTTNSSSSGFWAWFSRLGSKKVLIIIGGIIAFGISYRIIAILITLIKMIFEAIFH